MFNLLKSCLITHSVNEIIKKSCSDRLFFSLSLILERENLKNKRKDNLYYCNPKTLLKKILKIIEDIIYHHIQLPDKLVIE